MHWRRHGNGRQKPMSREIQLSQGKVALVDDADFERLAVAKWCVTTNGYAISSSAPDGRGGKRHTTMHRLLMGSPEGMVVHHKNGDTLDNRRDNLEILTHSEHWKLPRSKSNRTGFLRVRVISQTHAAVKKLAAKYGVSMAVIVRWSIAAYLDKEEDTDGE